MYAKFLPVLEFQFYTKELLYILHVWHWRRLRLLKVIHFFTLGIECELENLYF